jgi:hypothetical protein
MILDVLYAANLEELQNVVEQLTETIKIEYNERNKDRHFDPSIVGLEQQIKVVAIATALTDGSTVFDIEVELA